MEARGMMPNDPHCIAAVLRTMPADRLALARHTDFQRWPAAVITPAPIIRELIDNERARRLHRGQ